MGLRPMTVVRIVAAVALAAAIDGNVTHWSTAPTAFPSGGPAAADTVLPSSDEPAGAPASDGHWAAPLPAGSFALTELDDPHHGHPSIDLPAAAGTPVTAVTGGRVKWVGDDCGLGILITDPNGVRWTYCHASERIARNGSTVNTGDQIGTVGSTGNSTGPHLHLQVFAGGALRCPGPLLAAIYAGRPAPDPQALPTRGCVS
jgi:murein DD-endopeptidase MepM/ murein hydrolase activator NlpD